MTNTSVPSAITRSGPRALAWAAAAWLAVAALGQLAFVVFILAFYGVRTIHGDLAAWNDKPLIDGYVAGDRAGNLVFAAHVLPAALVTLAGLAQMTPALRRAWPAAHRWSGRVFLGVGCLLAASGAWLTLVRGTFLSEISAVAILINGLLIVAFSALAWRAALRRRFDRHRVWALRAFMAISGVWFLRVGLMGWVVINGGTVGMNRTMSGPADIVLIFGSYLIPLALLQLYFAAGNSARAPVKLAVAGLIAVATLYTLVGAFGAATFMWNPYL